MEVTTGGDDGGDDQMPAAPGLTDIRIDPQPPSTSDHVEIRAECRNHGDAPTGGLIVRFGLDAQDTFDAPMTNVPPNDTGWARGSHPPLSEVSHGVLDVHGAATDLDRSGHGQITRHFEVGASQAHVRGDGYLAEMTLTNAIVARINDRFTRGVDLVVHAVGEFADAARGRIRNADLRGDVQFDFDNVLWAFASTVPFCVPGANTELGVIGKGVDLMSTLQRQFGSGYLSEPGTRNKLNKAVDDFELAVGPSLRELVAGADARVRARLDLNGMDNPPTGIEWRSNDSAHVDALCDRLGVEEPTEADTVDPIRQALDAQFEISCRDIERNLLRRAGYEVER